MRHGKKYQDAAKQIDRQKQYEPAEALALVKKSAVAKFDETVEIHIRTGCDSRHADLVRRVKRNEAAGRRRPDHINNALNPCVDAAVDLVTTAVKQLLSGIKIDALVAHQIPDNIPNDDFFVVRINLLMILLVWSTFENQRLLDRLLPGVVVNIALFVHLAKDNLLPGFIVFFIVERVIIGGLVGNPDDGGAFGET